MKDAWCPAEEQNAISTLPSMTSPEEDQPEEPGSRSDDRASNTYSRLRDLIIRGQLAPGSRIVETDIAERLGVSRTPVRTALQRLEQEGFIKAERRSGGRSRPVVSPLTKEDAHEVMYLLGEFEGLAARWTAELPDEQRQQVVVKLRSLNERMGTKAEAEIEQPDRIRFFDIDSVFHRTFVEAAAGPRLQRLHRSYRPQAERYFRFYVAAHEYSLDRSLNEHEEMIEGIASADPDAAEEAVGQNWRGAEERLQQAIDLAGELGSW